MLKLQKPLKKIRSSCMSKRTSRALTTTHFLRGSQEERITILKMAITEKGIISGDHYDPMITQPRPSHTTTASDPASNDDTIEEDGVYL